MSEVYFTSDLHFGHQKPFIYEVRGFDTVEEMNEAIIERYNSRVKDNDTVYILGDCICGIDVETGTKLLNRLRGHKLLCIGNHDSDARLKYWMQNEVFEAYEFAFRFKYKKWGFYCTHFPTIVGNYDSPKWLGLYAHTHQSAQWEDEFSPNYQTANMYNVGVDAHDCYPVHIDEVLARVKAEIEKERIIYHG